MAAAWLFALRHQHGPTVLILSRQNLPVIQRDTQFMCENLARGGYIVSETPGRDPDVVLIGTGSELQLAIAAKAAVENAGMSARVVSMPSCELFLRQDDAYRNSIIPSGCKCVVVEAGIRQGWDRIAGSDALYITQEDYGHSAPAEVLAEKLGFTPSQVSDKVLAWLRQ